MGLLDTGPVISGTRLEPTVPRDGSVDVHDGTTASMRSVEDRSTRKYLVIVRAGAQSLHTLWLEGSASLRTFDLVVSYYDKVAFECHRPETGVSSFFKPGGKWDGIAATLDALGSDLDAYDYIWLPDDDIASDFETIDRMFLAMSRHGLSVGQPALTPQSYFTHFLCIRCPGLSLRLTNFVEIMVPCLKRDVLEAIRPQFGQTMSGFGLDFIWCRLPQSGEGRCGILDEVAVHHTRPIGSALKARMAIESVSATDEEKRLNQVFGVTKRATPLVYALRTPGGKAVWGKRRAAVIMVLLHGKAMISGQTTGRHYGIGRLFQLLRRQFTRVLDIRLLTDDIDRKPSPPEDPAPQASGVRVSPFRL